MSINQKIANRIKELRLKKGITQENLSFECGKDRSYIAHLESRPRNIAITNLEIICKALNVELWEFIKGLK